MKKLFLVTGGAGDIGAAIVKTLLESGVSVDYTYFSKPLDDAIHADYASALNGYQVDLSDPAAVDNFLKLKDEAGMVYDGIIHCAAQTYDSLLATTNLTHAKNVMDVNFWAFCQIATAVLRPMMRRRTGVFIAISSIASFRQSKGNGIYAASKAALDSYVRTLGIEYASKGIRSVSINPGYVETKMIANYGQKLDAAKNAIPAKRMARPMEIANLVKFLVSTDADYINSTSIVIDGGVSSGVNIA